MSTMLPRQTMETCTRDLYAPAESLEMYMSCVFFTGNFVFMKAQKLQNKVEYLGEAFVKGAIPS